MVLEPETKPGATAVDSRRDGGEAMPASRTAERQRGHRDERAERRPAPLREWLARRIPGSPLLGWLGPIALALFAAFLRFDRLGIPRAVVFDETYYAKDSFALLKFGWEHNTVKDADKILLAPGTNVRNPPIWADGASFVAHPPAGKWLIAIGEWIFGATPFG